MLVSIVPQPTLQMRKGILVGHQFDAALLAVGIDLTNFRRRHRRGVLPDCGVLCVGEGVLRIELQFVVAQQRQRIN